MRLISRLRSSWRNLVHRDHVEDDLDDELRAMFELLVDENARRGMHPEQARRAATLELGRIDAVKEQVRHARGGALLETFAQDIRYACRLMGRNPVFTTLVVLTLALGVGANTAVFTMVDAVVLKRLPVPDPSRLVLLDNVTQRGERQNMSYPLFERIRAEGRGFAGVFAALDGTERMDIAASAPGSQPEEGAIQLVSGEYFGVLGVRAFLGRTLAADDERNRTGHIPAVLSYSFWKRRFGGDSGVLGRHLRIKDQPVTVVGVAPAGFFGDAVGRAPDIWVPLAAQPRFGRRSLLEPVNVGWLRVVGRLAPDVSADQAGAALAVMLAGLKTEPSDLGAFSRHLARIEPSDGSRGQSDFRERFFAPLRILFASVAVVLLIACANVSNLLLARAAARQHEISVRLAIGAGRGRLIRQLLTESLLLAMVGGAAGLLFASWGARLLVALALGGSAAIPLAVTPDARILAFCATLSLGTVLIFGVAPALTVSKGNAGTSLKLTPATGTPGGLSRSLLVLQVALSLVLLTGAALFVRTLHNLRTRDLGFAAGSLLEVHVRSGPGADTSHEVDLSRRLLERLSNAPGVQAATFAHAGFGTGISRTCCLAVDGYLHEPNENREIRTLGVGPGYFATLRLPILRGRDFVQREGTADPRLMPSVAIVNEAFERRYVGFGGNGVGRRFGWGDPPKVTYGVEIIGVVADAVYDDLREESRPLIYFPFLWGDEFIVRAAGPPEALMPTLRHAVQSVDRNLEAPMRTVSEVLDRAVVREKLLARLSSFFGILATTLAGIGLYGLMAYTVVARTREIGIRMALGAAAGSVLRSELGRALRLAFWGIGAGVPIALAAGQLIRSQLFGVSATDPIALVIVATLLALVAAVAALVPARRAARVDPIVALRCE